MTAIGREIGTLIVVVLKAKNLPNKRHIGKQDPYCSVVLNGEKRRTKAIKRGGQHPEWDEEIRFTLFEDIEDLLTRPADGAATPPPVPPKVSKGPPSIQGGKLMKIACFADDNREPELIGETNVDLTEVLTKGETDEWFPLTAKEKYAGEVYLELTFWSNEPAPKKKSKAKHGRETTQYGGAGSFVPFSEHSSPDGISGNHPSSRVPSMSSIHEDYARSSVHSSLRSSNSSAKIDLYMAPYERKSSYHSTMVDSVSSDFAELAMSDVRHRRDTFPPLYNTYPPARPPSVQPLQTQATNGGQNTYLDFGSASSYDRPVTPNGHQVQGSFPPPAQPYQAPFDTGNSMLHNPPRGPRHSLPNPPPAGFAPMLTPTPSGFMPLHNQPESSGFAPRPGPTPVPMGYGFPPSSSHPSSFAPLTSHTPAPSGFIPPSSFPLQYQYPTYRYSSATPTPYMPSSSVPPPPSLPPQQYPPPYPPSSVPPHSHSAPPPQHGGFSSATPSPPHDHSPTAQSSLGGTPPSFHGSRPLPQPQPSAGNHARRQSSLPVPPGGGGISPSRSPSRQDLAYQGGAYPPTVPYNPIPPPPPSQFINPPWNLNHQNNFAVPPPPPLPLSQSQSDSPPMRPSLPQPPAMPSHQSQQPIYQHIPPPPTNTSQHYFPGSRLPPQYPPPNQALDGPYYA